MINMEEVQRKYGKRKDIIIMSNKFFVGAKEGVAKKTGNAYCFAQFLDINNFGSGEVSSLSVENDKLPAIVDELVCGDMVDIIVTMPSLTADPVLVDILSIASPSLIVDRSSLKKEKKES